MNKVDTKLLKSLIEIPSPSGFEQTLVYHIRDKLVKILPSTVTLEIDYHNNLVISIPALKKPSKTVIVDAHADQLGFLVTNVNKYGFISVNQIGGHDIQLIRARNALVLTENGIINGVVDAKPIHLMEGDEDFPSKTSDLVLDIGIRNRKQVLEMLSIGDPIILKPSFEELYEGNFVGSGFDDKIGCFTLIKVIQKLIASRHRNLPTIKFIFSAQEEIGCFGSREVVRRETPDLFIGVDVIHATDYPNVDERDSGRCILGEGSAIMKGINIYRPVNNLLLSIADKKKIPYQIIATNSYGTNAGMVSHTNDGVRVLDIGIPLRNMHSPVEIINEKDVESAVDLITQLLIDKRLKSKL